MSETEVVITKNIVAMDEEPIPGMTPEDARAWYMAHHDEKGLATALAAVNNKFWWVEDNIYDYEEGTKEYKEACDITDAWGALMDELENEIIDVLKAENTTLPDAGQREILAPFMKRNGYEDGDGWWIPLDGEE